jgi:hypothetical protein
VVVVCFRERLNQNRTFDIYKFRMSTVPKLQGLMVRRSDYGRD